MFRPISGHPQVYSLCLKHFEEGIFLPQYVLITNCEPGDDLNRSKHVVLHNKLNLVVFGRILTLFLL
jgi:hypothetical protein